MLFYRGTHHNNKEGMSAQVEEVTTSTQSLSEMVKALRESVENFSL
jgi:methyl-accepting chemotaxis protein